VDIDEKRISDFAYYIWQSEGEPEGEEARHWEMARKLAEAERSSPPVHVQETFPDAASKHSEGNAKPRSGGSVERSSAEDALDVEGQQPRP
jgi:hypothetical protein